MTFAQVVADVLPKARTDAESLMVDRCTIRRVDRTNPVRDPETGEETFPATVVYQGRCKVQRYDGQSATGTEVAGRVVTVDRLQVHLPVSTGPVLVDDEVTVDMSVHDDDLVGRTFRVASPHAKSFATAQRVGAEEVTG